MVAPPAPSRRCHQPWSCGTQVARVGDRAACRRRRRARRRPPRPSGRRARPSRIACAQRGVVGDAERGSRSACARPYARARAAARARSAATTFAATRARKRSRPLGRRPCTSSCEELAHRLGELAVVGTPCASQAAARSSSSSSTSYSCSQTRRPIAASSTERLVARQVAPRLLHAADAPPHGAEDLPPAHDVAVDACGR